MRVELQGFKSAETPPVTLEAKQVARLDFQLAVGSLEDTVEVTAVAPLLQTESPTVGEVISGTTVGSLPLNGRNTGQLSLLLPGVVTPDPASFSTQLRNFDGGRPYVNGNREQTNNYTIDGIDMNESIDNLVAYQPSPDALAEISVETSNYAADTGNVAGAVISNVTKSGTNRFAGNAFEFFRGSRFEYTLQPPLLGENSVDEFLFDAKQGFCEHFASSFVFLMRAAGVPARVVTGYQGGDTNPVDGYMVVRQADAHAWAEVWLAGGGWTRVDPTAAAVPVRVELGITAAAPAGQSLLMRANLNWLKGLRNNWEALTNQWNQWVLGYNPDRQREMLAWLGVRQPNWETMTLMLFWSVAGVVLLTALWLLRGIRRGDAVKPRRGFGDRSHARAPNARGGA